MGTYYVYYALYFYSVQNNTFSSSCIWNIFSSSPPFLSFWLAVPCKQNVQPTVGWGLELCAWNVHNKNIPSPWHHTDPRVEKNQTEHFGAVWRLTGSWCSLLSFLQQVGHRDRLLMHRCCCDQARGMTASLSASMSMTYGCRSSKVPKNCCTQGDYCRNL